MAGPSGRCSHSVVSRGSGLTTPRAAAGHRLSSIASRFTTIASRRQQRSAEGGLTPRGRWAAALNNSSSIEQPALSSSSSHHGRQAEDADDNVASTSTTTTTIHGLAPSCAWPAPARAAAGDRRTRLLALERVYHLSGNSSRSGATLDVLDALDALTAAPAALNPSSSSSSPFAPLPALLAHPLLAVSLDDPPPTPRPPAPPNGGPNDPNERAPDYYANVGDAIRTLRDDIPHLFQRDLNYAIYSEDIAFRDPRNTFTGLSNYKLIFWSLRFHGRIFFSSLRVTVARIWQPEDGSIKMRWTVRGVPRVPWEAEGVFDGVSTYRLDKSGTIIEHQVDNIVLRDPPLGVATNPLFYGLNLSPQQQACPGAWVGGDGVKGGGGFGAAAAALAAWLARFSWVRLYAAAAATVSLQQAGSGGGGDGGGGDGGGAMPATAAAEG